MNGYSQTFSSNRYVPNEGSLLTKPRNPDPNKRAIIYAHGATGNSYNHVDYATQPTLSKTFGKLALDQYVILAADWGGSTPWANDASLAAMEAGWAWLQASGLCKTDKVILTGASMGAVEVSRFAAEHPGSVAGMMLWMPAFDLEDFRNNNRAGLRDSINTAWGLAAGSSVAGGGAPVPARGLPLSRLADVAAIPTRIEYSTADAVAIPAAVDTYAAGRANVTAHVSSATGAHGDPAIAGQDTAAVLAFLQSIA